MILLVRNVEAQTCTSARKSRLEVAMRLTICQD